MECKQVQQLATESLTIRPQIRKQFDDERILGLARSIDEVDILHPILVRREGDAFVVIDGDRRLRAAKRAGLATVPAIIDDRELSEVEVILRQIATNTQREALTPMERARAFASLITESGWTAAEVARRSGFSEATVSRLTALLRLPPEVIQRVESGELSANTAYRIAIAGDSDSQVELADEAASDQLARDDVAQRRKA